jgi:hypothetical protein
VAPTVSLDKRRAEKFLRLLADEPFVCLVVTDGELRLFSKDMPEEKLARLRTRLIEIQGDTPDGEG